MDFSGLNDTQAQAVQRTEGPLLILAGAGSGKTRTLTMRTAYLVEKGIPPRNILCITFTNKAANEMKTRIENLVGPDAQSMWICTFHSMCARILRTDGERIGLKRSFTIYDMDDVQRLIKQCLRELNMDEKSFPPRAVAGAISDAKNKGRGPEAYATHSAGDDFNMCVADVYKLYEKRLKSNNAVDFDNLLLKTVELFRNDAECLEYYSSRFRYINVDEYQDTNITQYNLVKMLASHQNICVVGDDDQSIYAWRGADIRNILEFEHDFPDAEVIRLERNYRSTGNILNAANHVIENNSGRKGKTLWTGRGDGEKVEVFRAVTERDEADFILSTMKSLLESYRYSDCAVLYRTNAQSRVIEEGLMQRGIPYRVIGGLKFYDRKEVKDLVAYLRFLNNPDDDISLLRIINVPRRGIGDTTIQKVRDAANINDMSAWEVISDAREFITPVRAADKLESFAKEMARTMAMAAILPLDEFVEHVIDQTGLIEQYNNADEEEYARIDNIKEMHKAVQEYVLNIPDATLQVFLENVALVSDVDNYDEELNAVTLLTMHSAKGLEFPVVFMPGMEEGLFPHSRCLDDEEALEEERRLCYVGITRAMDRLYMSYTLSRTKYGMRSHGINNSASSRFLGELPDEGVVRNDVSGGVVTQYASFEKEKHGNEVFSFARAPKWSSGGATDIEEGDNVVHPKFGNGTVTLIMGSGSTATADIDFGSEGIKRIALKYAKLEKTS